MKKHAIISIFILYSATSFCQNIAHDIVFGSSTLCSQKGITAINKNIAGLSISDNSKWIIGINQTYSIPELWNVSASYLVKIKKRGILPITLTCHGPGNFLNFKLKFGYAQMFSKYFSVNIRFLAEYYFIDHSENMFNAGFEVGTLYLINNKASVGFIFTMPNLVHNTTENAWRNIQIETAFSYYLFDKANINFGIRKEQYTNIEFIVSIVGQIAKNMGLFLAYNSGNSQISSGLTIIFKSISIALIMETNFNLGASPEIQFIF
ncbi:MAG: hypothetical protein LBP67_03610 [Bacteroidales bacterium]|jgi:hypothetical protein|nr:hypothetical protein [Bacteroidales bacterium]